ncbi:MAG: hypothetical protein MUP61_05735, partial [Burkholderiales bacterium]|nr:hypothetical protein [Burkholderiales bacterium]
KGAASDKPDLLPPRHIATLPAVTIRVLEKLPLAENSAGPARQGLIRSLSSDIANPSFVARTSDVQRCAAACALLLRFHTVWANSGHSMTLSA